jgi:hypothetical protein
LEYKALKVDYRIGIISSCINRGVEDDDDCRYIVVLGFIEQSVGELEVKWDTNYLY